MTHQLLQCAMPASSASTQARRRPIYIVMATTQTLLDVTPAETPAERIRRQAAVIAQAKAEIQAGEGIEFDNLEAWLDELDCNVDAPLPPTVPGTLAR